MPLALAAGVEIPLFFDIVSVHFRVNQSFSKYKIVKTVIKDSILVSVVRAVYSVTLDPGVYPDWIRWDEKMGFPLCLCQDQDKIENRQIRPKTESLAWATAGA
jgi:hypothetical protein